MTNDEQLHSTNATTGYVPAPGLVSLQSFVDNYSNYPNNTVLPVLPALTTSESNSNVFSFQPIMDDKLQSYQQQQQQQLQQPTQPQFNDFTPQNFPSGLNLNILGQSNLMLQDFKFTPRCLTPLNLDQTSLLFPASETQQQQQSLFQQQLPTSNQQPQSQSQSQSQFQFNNIQQPSQHFSYPQQPSRLSNTYYYSNNNLGRSPSDTDDSLSPHLRNTVNTMNTTELSNVDSLTSDTIDTVDIMFSDIPDADAVVDTSVGINDVLLPSQNIDSLINDDVVDVNVGTDVLLRNYHSDFSDHYESRSNGSLSGNDEFTDSDGEFKVHLNNFNDENANGNANTNGEDESNVENSDEDSDSEESDDHEDHDEDDYEYNRNPPTNVTKTRRRSSTITSKRIVNKNKRDSVVSVGKSKRNSTSSTNEKQFKCKKCSSSFTRKTRLTEHVNRVHLGKILHFKCEQCGTRLSSKENLTRHSIVHTDKFKCDFCNRRFDRSYRFQRHLEKCNLHTTH